MKRVNLRLKDTVITNKKRRIYAQNEELEFKKAAVLEKNQRIKGGLLKLTILTVKLGKPMFL
jgi:hypothetical protein